MVQPLAKPDRGQQLASSWFAITLAAQLGGQHHILQRRHGREQQERLEHKADLLGAQSGPPLLIQLTKGFAEDLDLPLTRQIEPGQQSQ